LSGGGWYSTFATENSYGPSDQENGGRSQIIWSQAGSLAILAIMMGANFFLVMKTNMELANAG